MEQLHSAKDKIEKIQWRRAYHVITENARVLSFVKALERNDIKTLAQLMEQSHLSLKNHFEVSVEAIDFLVEQIKTVVGDYGGARMTGGGFGGCVVSLIPHDKVNDVIHHIENSYPALTGLTPTIYPTSPVSGAFQKRTS